MGAHCGPCLPLALESWPWPFVSGWLVLSTPGDQVQARAGAEEPGGLGLEPGSPIVWSYHLSVVPSCSHL